MTIIYLDVKHFIWLMIFGTTMQHKLHILACMPVCSEIKGSDVNNKRLQWLSYYKQFKHNWRWSMLIILAHLLLHFKWKHRHYWCQAYKQQSEGVKRKCWHWFLVVLLNGALSLCNRNSVCRSEAFPLLQTEVGWGVESICIYINYHFKTTNTEVKAW